MQYPALGLIEFKSLAKGIFATDAIAKKAPVNILTSNPICPGKYLVIFAGEVGDVEESFVAGVAAGGDMVVNHLFLPYIHASIIPAISGATNIQEFGAIAIVETFAVASCIAAADKAVKIAPISLVEIRLANGLGGKAYFVMTGELSDIEAAVGVAKDHVKDEGLLAGCEIIAAPHKEFLARGLYW